MRRETPKPTVEQPKMTRAELAAVPWPAECHGPEWWQHKSACCKGSPKCRWRRALKPSCSCSRYPFRHRASKACADSTPVVIRKSASFALEAASVDAAPVDAPASEEPALDHCFADLLA